MAISLTDLRNVLKSLPEAYEGDVYVYDRRKDEYSYPDTIRFELGPGIERDDETILDVVLLIG